MDESTERPAGKRTRMKQLEHWAIRRTAALWAFAALLLLPAGAAYAQADPQTPSQTASEIAPQAAQDELQLPEYGGWWLPKNYSTDGAVIDRLFYMILVVVAVVFVAVQLTLIVFLIKYRARPGGKATYIHGNNRLEILWTAVPALFLAALSFLSQQGWMQIKPSQGFRQGYQGAESGRQADLVIEVIAEQFAWNIRYPGADGVFGPRRPGLVSNANPVGIDRDHPDGADDISLTGQMHIPINKRVQVNLASKDVLHSFFLPHSRVKQDAVPGMTIQLFFDVTRAGKYEIACAELCGIQHYNMKGTLTAHPTEEAFQAAIDRFAPVVIPDIPEDTPEDTQ